MQNKKKKPIKIEHILKSVDGLARMTQKEFALVHSEIKEFKGKTEDRFNKIDERFNKIDNSHNYLHGRMDLIGREIAEIKEKLDNIVYRHELDTLKLKIAKLERKLAIK